eukprot:scaffold57830_cov74-Phaeocystis_antarctica.AAC.2
MGALAKEQIVEAIIAARCGPAFVEGGALLFGAVATAADCSTNTCSSSALPLQRPRAHRVCRSAAPLLRRLRAVARGRRLAQVRLPRRRAHQRGTRYGGSRDPAAPFAVAL